MSAGASPDLDPLVPASRPDAAPPAPARPTSLVLSPFRALRYPPDELPGATSPPYDVVDAAGVEALEATSEHNVVRLILPRDEGSAGDDPVRARGRTLLDWREQGVLRARPGAGALRLRAGRPRRSRPARPARRAGADPARGRHRPAAREHDGRHGQRPARPLHRRRGRPRADLPAVRRGRRPRAGSSRRPTRSSRSSTSRCPTGCATGCGPSATPTSSPRSPPTWRRARRSSPTATTATRPTCSARRCTTTPATGPAPGTRA